MTENQGNIILTFSLEQIPMSDYNVFLRDFSNGPFFDFFSNSNFFHWHQKVEKF
jgi:hypothetical protein